MMKLNKVFLIGFLSGAIIASGVTIALLHRSENISKSSQIAAEVGGEKLTQAELHKSVASDLVPIENDEYRILERGVKAWRDAKLLEQEAKAQGVSLEELDQKNIWTKVQLTYEEVLDYYNKNRRSFSQPFDQIKSSIIQELRRNAHDQAKVNYLAELEKKYAAKIYLTKPASFIENLGLPIGASKPIERAQGKPIIRLEAPIRGEKTAPITIVEFADFHCPFCKTVAPTLTKLLSNYPGKIQWIFRHFPLSMTHGQDSFLTHEASVCAQEQGKFWEFHDAVFNFKGVPAESDLYAIADSIGVDKNKFQECVKNGKYDDFLRTERNEASQKKIEGIPTLFINGQMLAGAYPYDQFVKVIEGILDPTKAVPFPSASPPAVTEPAQFDDLEGRPRLGSKNAPITLVEFGDFHCPFCKSILPTLEKLKAQYPEQIQLIWRHYPLPMHAGADRTHEASECANEQEKFWSYHDKLFETQGGPKDDKTLIKLAEETGLKKKKFEKCLENGKYKKLIQQEIAKGAQVGVRGTPAVFVNGKLVSGAQPFENFDRLIQQELKKSPE